MDAAFTPAQQGFRAEARAWLAAHVPAKPLASMDTREGFEQHREWERLLFDAGWAVVSWPAAYGGRDAGLIEWLIFEEEYHRAGAPGRVGQNGVVLLAPVLFAHGTADQRDRFLRRMGRGEDVWVQGWSEPEAGSDLAALRSRAVRADGGWLLSGQKTWSSRGAFGHWLFGLFRTGDTADAGEAAGRHRGLTYFLVPLDAAGVTVRPIAQLDGEPGFAEIFFDDVFVPDADVLGAVGGGWRIAMSTTSSERGLALRSPGRYSAAAERLVALYRGGAGLQARGGTDPRDEVVQAWMDAEAYRLYTYAAVARTLAGEPPGARSSLSKLYWSELDIRLHEAALRLLGPLAELTGDAADAVDAGRWLDGYLFALAGPIYAGTNEIQRSIVAERLLGLPRGAR